ncbi:MAG: hypothetical protein V7707_08520 [Motiliproteus sp.]
MNIRYLLLVLFMLGLTGCGTHSTQPSDASVGGAKIALAPVTTATVPAEPAVVVKSAFDPKERQRILKVLELLDRADLAMMRKRLTEPRGDNAVDYYRQVLKLQPGYPEAEQALQSIVDRYVQWSDAAVQQGRLTQGRGYLLKARQIAPQHPSVVAATERLQRQAKQSDDYVRLSADELKLKSPAVKSKLARLADRIYAENARVVIEAPTDLQGRWIYQQLNDRHEEFRIRANLRFDPQPGIRLLTSTLPP